MNDKIERFKKRKKLKEQIKRREGFSHVADENLVQKHLNSSVDTQVQDNIDSKLNDKYDFEFNIDVSPNEVETLLVELQGAFNNLKFDKLFNDCKSDVLKSIAGPFGLGAVVAHYDKVGGNVDTVHNARNGVYASEEERARKDNQKEYDKSISKEYHSHENYIEVNRQASADKKAGKLIDKNRGKKVDRNADIDLDHVISAKEIHDDPGRILAEKDGVELANVDSNLNPTDRSLNRSMKDKSMEEYSKWLDDTKEQRQGEIKKLNERLSDGSVSDSEKQELKKKLNKLQKQEEFDPEAAKEIDEKARSDYEKTVNDYYTSKKFAKKVASEGAKEGAKMGIQQALGALITEFFVATFDEIKELYKEGRSEEKLFEDLKARLKRVVKRVVSKWKDALGAFKDGFISGFLSNLVTTIVNAFATTGKRLVRMIREGFFSLLKAVKILLFPPEGMTFGEAAHEATKLIAAGGMVVAGVALEEYIDKQIRLVPGLEIIADIITGVLVGSITAIATTFIVYSIDQMDLFKVNDKERHQFIMDKLQASIKSSKAKRKRLLEELSYE